MLFQPHIEKITLSLWCVTKVYTFSGSSISNLGPILNMPSQIKGLDKQLGQGPRII